MNMKAMAGIAALALAAFVAASPAKADADVLQVVPDTIDAASDLVVGTIDAVLGDDDDYDYAYYDAGPRGRCHPGREQGPDGSWHPVTVCE